MKCIAADNAAIFLNQIATYVRNLVKGNILIEVFRRVYDKFKFVIYPLEIYIKLLYFKMN